MIAPPFVTCFTTRATLGFNWSRFGPTVPLEPAAFSVWQLAQAAEAKTLWPAARVAAGAGVAAAGVEVVLAGSELDRVSVRAGVPPLASASFFSTPKTSTAGIIAMKKRRLT